MYNPTFLKHIVYYSHGKILKLLKVNGDVKRIILQQTEQNFNLKCILNPSFAT